MEKAEINLKQIKALNELIEKKWILKRMSNHWISFINQKEKGLEVEVYLGSSITANPPIVMRYGYSFEIDKAKKLIHIVQESYKDFKDLLTDAKRKQLKEDDDETNEWTN